MTLSRQQNRMLIHDKFDGRCAYCGNKITFKEMQVDHIIPKAQFIARVDRAAVPEFLKHLTALDCERNDNKFPSCRSCNHYKETKDLETFRSELAQVVRRLNEQYPTYRLAKRFGMIEETGKEIVFHFETQQGNGD